MAKRKTSDRDDDDDRVEPVPAGSAEPADDRATVEGGTPRGTTQYPPPASDTSGERTGNVPPQKQLPTQPPPSENPPAESTVQPLGQSIQAVDAELARLRSENEDLRRRLGDREPVAAAGAGEGAKVFRVAMPGTDHPHLDVRADDEEQAKREYLSRLGVWSPPVQPVVSDPPEQSDR